MYESCRYYKRNYTLPFEKKSFIKHFYNIVCESYEKLKIPLTSFNCLFVTK